MKRDMNALFIYLSVFYILYFRLQIIHVHENHGHFEDLDLAMSSNLSVDVLQLILENVDKADLIAVCHVNKVCCSCSQDILYRNIHVQTYTQLQVCQTLADSPHLASRVRSFSIMESFNHTETMAKALQNMSSLRNLILHDQPASALDGCTFKLDSFSCNLPYDESLRKFLNSQPSIIDLELRRYYNARTDCEFEASSLPNLTRVSAQYSWIPRLVPGRPVSEVDVIGYAHPSGDLSFFSNLPIRKLTIAYSLLYPNPGHLMASIFPSLVHLTIRMGAEKYHRVRLSFFFFSLSNDVDQGCHSSDLTTLNGLETCLPSWFHSESLRLNLLQTLLQWNLCHLS
jgi:hypothetical protein